MLFLFLFGFQSWELKPLPKEVSIRGIQATSDATVFVSGTQGTLAKTEDDGQTWTFMHVPDSEALDFRDVQVLDNASIVLMSAGEGKASNIFKSSDGGQSWEKTFEMTEEKGFLNAISFWDDQNGVALGDPIEGTHYLVITNDAGKSWSRLNPSGIPAMHEGEYGFAASGSNLMTSGKEDLWIVTGGTHSRLFHAKNRGKTWTAKDLDLQKGQASTGAFSIAVSGHQIAVVGGDYQNPEKQANNALFGTLDKLMASDKQPSYRSCVQFHPTMSGSLVAVGRAGCSISQDNGKTWSDFGDQGFYTFDFSPQGQGWAAGNKGRVARLVLD